MDGDRIGRTAARAVSAAKKTWLPGFRDSRAIAKQVLPAAFKPLHSLWHDILGFIFLALAGVAAWKVWRSPERLDPRQLALIIVFIVVMAAYGVSSMRKSRRISRS